MGKQIGQGRTVDLRPPDSAAMVRNGVPAMKLLNTSATRPPTAGTRLMRINHADLSTSCQRLAWMASAGQRDSNPTSIRSMLIPLPAAAGSDAFIMLMTLAPPKRPNGSSEATTGPNMHRDQRDLQKRTTGFSSSRFSPHGISARAGRKCHADRFHESSQAEGSSFDAASPNGGVRLGRIRYSSSGCALRCLPPTSAISASASNIWPYSPSCIENVRDASLIRCGLYP